MHTLDPAHARQLLHATLLPLGAVLVGFGGPNLALLAVPLTVATGSADAIDASFQVAWIVLRVGMALVLVGILASLALLGVYVADIARRPTLSRDARIGWVLAVVVTLFPGMLAYWWVVVRADAAR